MNSGVIASMATISTSLQIEMCCLIATFLQFLLQKPDEDGGEHDERRPERALHFDRRAKVGRR
jgi:hypothetical protein